MKFLLITPIYNASATTGAGQRTLLLFRALKELGAVDVLLMSEAVCSDLENDIESFRQAFDGAGTVDVMRSTPRFVTPPTPGSGPSARLGYQLGRLHHALLPRSHFYKPTEQARTALGRLLGQGKHDLVVGRYLQPTALSGALDQQEVPVVVDLDDLDEVVLSSRSGMRSLPLAKRLGLRLHLLQTIPLVRALRKRCAHLLVASADDLPLLEPQVGTIVPNIPFPRERSRPIEENAASQVLLFVGSFGHRVNRDGVLRFAETCWPSIRQRHPDARFRIVGSGGWESLREQLRPFPGVEVVGTVDELEDEYAGAAFCVCPLLEGGGTKIKILEAVVFGRVIVASEHSARGFDRSRLGAVVPAGDDAELVSTCIEMLEHPELRARLVAECSTYVAQTYSTLPIYGSVRRAVEAVIGRTSSG